jgi:hypothetical protein
MENFFNPDKADLIREAIIVITGFVIRWLELRKLKKQKNDQL